MATVLRAYGDEFDVDAFISGCILPICAVMRRGAPTLPARQPDGRTFERSGVHVPVSNASFDEFSTQVSEATAFLQREMEHLLRLREFPGVDSLTLDFGIERPDTPVHCDFLPPELIRLACSLGLGIELSFYASSLDEANS